MSAKTTILLCALALAAAGTLAYFAGYDRQPEHAAPPAPTASQPQALSEAERREVWNVLLREVSQEYCDAEAGGPVGGDKQESVFVWQYQGERNYLVWWQAAGSYYRDEQADGTAEIHCISGSASSSNFLARLVRRNGRLQLIEQDMLAVQLKDTAVDDPYVVHPRFIESIRLNDDNTLNIVSAKHAYGKESEMEGPNFPSKQWRYRVRLPDMQVLEACYTGQTAYTKE